MCGRLLLSAAILARWWQPVASVEALNLLYPAMCTVSYRHIAMASETASKLGTFFTVVLFAVALAAAGVIRSEYSSDGGIHEDPQFPEGRQTTLTGSCTRQHH